MKTRTLRINTIAAIAGLLLAAGGAAYPQESAAPGVRDRSADQLVRLGDPVSFAADAVAGGSYQWMHTGIPIDGQTNSTLTIENTQISDAGFYFCNIASNADIVPTITASLEVYTITPEFDIVVYAAPIVSSGGGSTCPGAYEGYVNYIQTNGWGYIPSTNTTVYTATDSTRTNTKVEYVGAYGDEGCAKMTVKVPSPAVSPAYRFTIYFANNVPTTNYPITLVGFTP
jgi:hypothetical protein